MTRKPPTVRSVICAAIRKRHQLRLIYADGRHRVVEPHRLGKTNAGDLVLLAWYVSGFSKSTSGPGFRLYRVRAIKRVVVLPPTFAEPRPGYTSNTLMAKVRCEL